MDKAERRRLHQDMARLADGDREAFHSVFVALLPLLRRFAARELGGPDAEDAAQEALVKVFLHAGEFDPGRDALSWALGIAAYEIKTARGRRRRRREVEDETLAERRDPRPSPEDEAIASDLDVAIGEALSGLARSDAATLASLAAGERPEGVAPATFRKRVERGLERLRSRWKGIHDHR